MKSTTFIPENSVLLLIDHQVGTMQLIKNLPLDQVKRATLALAQMAKVLKLPVILTSSQEERTQGPLLPELQQLLPEAFEKRIKREGIVNAWKDEAFVSAVRATGRTQIIMAGVTTDVCLIYPSISAVEEGFEVQAVMDASGSPFDLSEELSRQRMHDAGVVLTTSNTLIAELVQTWATPEGQQLIGVLFGGLLPPILR
jgi:nicotinamidase-related amidase